MGAQKTVNKINISMYEYLRRCNLYNLPISALFLKVNWHEDLLQWKCVVFWSRYMQYSVPQSSAPRNRRNPSL